MNTTCVICGREHALFYTKHSNKRVALNYICDRVPKEKISNVMGQDGKPIWEKRYHTMIQEMEFQAGLDIPVRWSTRYGRDQNDRLQNKLEL